LGREASQEMEWLNLGVDLMTISIGSTLITPANVGRAYIGSTQILEASSLANNYGQVAFRSWAGSGVGSIRPSYVVNKPAGVVEGDLLVAFMWIYDRQTFNASVPSGWIQFADSPGVYSGIRAWYKIATASEPANYTFGLVSDSTYLAGAIAAFSGADPADPFAADINVATADSTTRVLPGIDVERAGSMLVFSGTSYTSTPTSVPAGMTRQALEDTVSTINTQLISAAGNSGSKSETTTNGTLIDNQWAAMMFAINPAPL